MVDQAKFNPRGIELGKHKLWSYTIELEDRLRLVWFKKNEVRLNEVANKANAKTVPQEDARAERGEVVEKFQKIHRHAVPPFQDGVPGLVDEGAIHSIMRPVDREVTALIYSSTQNDGRCKYLNERIQLIPEKRFYFPETTSFQYGWNMWKCAKSMDSSKFGRQKVIKTSFYRRRGVDKDPEWYREPAKLSPTVCGCI